MKRLCVAGLITKEVQRFTPPRSRSKTEVILLGRRGKEPNKGLFVLPGGGVEEGESLDQAFIREMKEETGLEILPDLNRWLKPDVIELADRVILVMSVLVSPNVEIKAGSDLYDLAWFSRNMLPQDISPVIEALVI